MIRITEGEVREMFGPDGNTGDYWLNLEPVTEGWVSADGLLREWSARDTDAWDPDDDGIEALMRNDFEGGGGLMGSTTELVQVRSALAASGRLLLAHEGGGRR